MMYISVRDTGKLGKRNCIHCTLHRHIAASTTSLITHDLLSSGLVPQSVEQQTIISEGSGFDSRQRLFSLPRALAHFLTTVLVKFSCDTSQPSREYPSLSPLPPLNVVFRNSSSQSCEPTSRGQGGEVCNNKCD